MPLCVLSVVGKYRTGKSYFINKVLLEDNEAFQIGSTVNACTKGLWLYRGVLKRNGKHVLVLDTEGLGALDVNKKSDSR